MLQFGPRALHPVGNDLLMIEGQFQAPGQNSFDRFPGSTCRVGARDRLRKAGGDRQVRHRDDPSARITARCPISTQLFQVQPRSIKIRLLAQLTVGGGHDVLVGVAEKTAGQSLITLVRLDTTLHKQDMKLRGAQSQDDEIDRDQDGRR